MPLTHIIHCSASASDVQQTLQARGITCELLREAHDCSLAPACRWLGGAPLTDEARLIGALDEAVAVLQRTRHAFKSRELGTLRRSIERLLQELSDSAV